MTGTDGDAAMLVLMVAAPGAGKSTWVKRHFRDDQVVSLDAYRQMVSGDRLDQKATPAAVDVMHTVLRWRMERKLTTVVDATNARRDIRDEIVKHAIGWMVKPTAVVLHTPVEVCIARQTRRRRPRAGAPNGLAVPETVIRRMHAQITADMPDLMTPWAGNIAFALHVHPGGHTFRTGYAGPTRRELSWLQGLRELRRPIGCCPMAAEGTTR